MWPATLEPAAHATMPGAGAAPALAEAPRPVAALRAGTGRRAWCLIRTVDAIAAPGGVIFRPGAIGATVSIMVARVRNRWGRQCGQCKRGKPELHNLLPLSCPDANFLVPRQYPCSQNYFEHLLALADLGRFAIATSRHDAVCRNHYVGDRPIFPLGNRHRALQPDLNMKTGSPTNQRLFGPFCSAIGKLHFQQKRLVRLPKLARWRALNVDRTRGTSGNPGAEPPRGIGYWRYWPAACGPGADCQLRGPGAPKQTSKISRRDGL